MNMYRQTTPLYWGVWMGLLGLLAILVMATCTSESTSVPTPTQAAIGTPTPEPTPTQAVMAAPTPEPTPTQAATATPTPEQTPTQVATATPILEPTPTQATTATPTPEPTPTQVATATLTPEPAPTQAATAIPTPEPTPTQPATTSFGPGTYQVGKEISAGTYAGKAGTGVLDSCSWVRLSGVSGEFSDTLAIDIANGQFYVEVLDTDKYFRTSCTVTALHDWPVPDEPSSKIEIGTHIIGRDISPGTYAGKAGTGVLDSCSWVRLSSVSGEFSDTLAIDIANGQFYVEVLDTDKYFRTSCVLELVE